MAIYTDTLTVTGTMTTAGTVSTLVQAGASGTAGEVDIFPTTASKGKTALTAADNTGNTTTTITTAAQATTRTYTIPDAGADASFVMAAAGVAAIGASGTAGELDVFPTTSAKGKTAITAADNTGNTTTTITTAAQGGARTYTVPDKGAAATFLLSTSTIGSSGIVGAWLPFVNFKYVDGTTLVVSAAAGKFGLTYTPGTAEFLITEAANSNTKTDSAAIDWVIPSTYVAGTNLTVTARCNYTVGAGTVGTHTLAAAAYLNTTAGAQGSTLIATAAQTVPSSDGAVTFTITGTTLTPGALLTLTFTLVIQDTGASNITARLNSVVIS